ncbi:rho GTPase-activating protein SYDE2 isoform X4 [Carcharodon carcharias]|uniref:rho GTPase-activating protein SYDE2 isoform X4 n=1 Tax=Carcharodon carcharias TaxID=13397 RepID=UPI001B7DC3B0|nr:rho GTPase-activating protein SYDE2 isoform X4 [Carcharodon carcharias]
MADPLRRTLFAKLRGKKSKKSPGGGTRSQEGKAKPPKERRRRQQQQQQEAGPGVVVGGAKVLAGSGSNGGEEQEQEEEEEEEEEEETRIPGIASGLGAQSPVPADEPGIAAQEMQPASGVQAAGGAGCPPEANGILCIGVAGLVAGALTGLELMEMSGSPLPTPLHASPSPGQQQPSRRQSIHSLDSQEEEEEEEEDYYDNQCLQGYYEPDIRGLRCPNLPTVPQSHLQTVLSQNCNRHRKHSLDSAQEKERLRTQLQEAYYLLIHAMHDMPMDNPASNRLGGVSCHSQDSVCTQSSVRVIDSDAWSSDEISLQQQVSDTDSLPGKHTGSPKKEFASKSIANLVSVIGRPSLPRSVSDGVINYANVSCLSDTESKDEQSEHTVHFRAFRGLHNEGQASCNAGSSHPSHSPSVNTSVCVKDVIQSSEGSMMLFKDSSCDVNKLRDSSDMVCGSCGKQDDSQGCSLKPPAVTVNKMQEWMHRGRMLSLEMKERISGSVRVSMPSGSLPGQATSKEVEVQKTSFPAAIRVQGNKTAPSPTSQRVLLTVAATDPSNGPVCAVAVVATAATTTEFSPPSSPNPLKKGTTINWSFPEKIKSPRTVRKLSMKMKKLPELSRKLSVKGTSNHNCNDNHNLSSKGNHGSSLSPGIVTNAASRNVISRYHLDSSVVSQNYKKKSSANSKSASKGGYLSDGDSPELVAKSGKHSCESKPAKGNIATSHKTHSTEIDIDAFRHYSFVDQPKCSQYISGLMSVHFYGAEDLKPPRIDSRDVFCAIQVDSVNKARTALLTCRTTFLDMDHTFNIELENAQHLKLVVFSWEPTPRRNRVCCHGTVVLPTLFRVSKMHQLAVKLEPRGLIYVKLTLMEQWENSLDSPDGEREPVMFGVEARKIVEKENTGLSVPLLMHKCIVEIEKRGCQVVGLYRLCGSAAVKKELREAFERDSKAVGLSENLYPDINVITGVLKDYLRELPSPLITKQLYEAVLDTMAKQPLKITSSGCENDFSDSEYTVGLLDCLPEVEKATLKMLLDHLKLVASYHEVNKMTCQNLAVCFGPVLLSQRQETSNHSHRVFTDSEELASALDFKKHIEVLHYLLQLWPVQNMGTKEHMESNGSSEQNKPINYVRRRKQRPAVLNLANAEAIGVLRPRQVRLDSPSNRYAGDWSSCGESYLLRSKEDSIEADYDDVPSEDTGSDEENTVADRTKCVMEPHAEAKSKEQTYEAYVRMQKINPALGHRVNLKDLQESIDTLIGNLERELSKNKLNATY